MILGWSNDGEKCNRESIKKEGFEINEERDIIKNKIFNESTGELSEEYSYSYNFVGFLVNEDDNIRIVFPKKFKVEEIDSDSSMIFELISTHMQRRPDIYIGEQSEDKYDSNYPFSAFFGVYDYYKRYGLHVECSKIFKPNINGKINWKETLRRTGYYLVEDEIVMFPYFYEKKNYNNNFITECMIFVIDYTIEKFDVLIKLDTTGERFPEHNFLEDIENTEKMLHSIRNEVFRDNLLELIDNLIIFFQRIKKGGAYYFKHYTFSTIWEDIVMSYLKNNFKEVKDNCLVFSSENTRHLDFGKKHFYPNKANKNHYISPDYYYSEGNSQFIFDAKYKSNISGIDYKQICYFMFLKDIIDNITHTKKYTETYSALILPSEKRESKIHFQMEQSFSQVNSDIKIMEEYLDIKEVIRNYLKY